MVLAIPGAAHHLKVAEPQLLELAAAIGRFAQALLVIGVFGPDLTIEDRIHRARGVDQRSQGLALGLGQRREVGFEHDRLKLCDLAGERDGVDFGVAERVALRGGLLLGRDRLIGR